MTATSRDAKADPRFGDVWRFANPPFDYLVMYLSPTGRTLDVDTWDGLVLSGKSFVEVGEVGPFGFSRNAPWEFVEHIEDENPNPFIGLRAWLESTKI
jgi:hypothetical protein